MALSRYAPGVERRRRIGAYGAGPAGFFDGVVDEVRVYNRALSAAEVQTDLATPVGTPAPDTTPPSTPTGFTAGTPTQTSIGTSWTASTDNVGVTGYRVYRGGTLVASPSSTSCTSATPPWAGWPTCITPHPTRSTVPSRAPSTAAARTCCARTAP